MKQSPQPCAVVSLPDIELEAQVSCATRRLVVIAPGLTDSVAKAIVKKWHELGASSVHIVLDLDPEVCRLGFGDLSAIAILQAAAEQIGSQVYQQAGLRVGVVVTDETTTIYSPVPRLVEAGGHPGERLNALRFDAPIAEASGTAETDLRALDLNVRRVVADDLQATAKNLDANPPVKFDIAQKVRVFNARFEFVEFELRGLFLSRKQVQIPSDLMGLARDPKAQKLLRSSFKLIEENSVLSGKNVVRLKQFIASEYLISLPGYGSVVLRRNKIAFTEAVETLKKYVERFKLRVEKELQTAIDANREVLTAALLPSVLNAPPARWKRYIGEHPTRNEVESRLRHELADVFGVSGDVLHDMKVTLVFKGVTYESLTDPEFIRIASEKIGFPEGLHEEYDAAKAKGHPA